MLNRKLQNLQKLRGVSALLVCCYHSRAFLNGDIQFGEILFKMGFIGVPIFFIISGLIMVHTTKELSSNTFRNVYDFLLKRIIRVVPLYYLCTIIFLLATNFKNFLDDGFVRIIKVFLFIPIGKWPPLDVGWTLNYEMFFYLLFGISFLFREKRYIFIYFAILILIFIVPLVVNEPLILYPYYYLFPKTYLDLIINPLLLFFLLGVFFGNTIVFFNFNTNLFKIYASFAILIFILFYFNYINFFQADLIICGLLVHSTLLLDYTNIKLPIPKIFIYFGDISYSIYLVHLIFIIYLPQFLTQIGLIQFINTKIIFLLIIILTIVSSAILNELIEKRFTKFLKNKLIRQN
ncbi:hypothetical protein C3L50_01500 [Flavobacterium alvei]|uniref:Acyltransferase 3 domain-containing protein n=1 Tax=Flavobacterium alvei TaxID=2080416 RepID=A0A2S5AGH1_9FLAO|nr:hypothetical protein C3L50_01500 [Flavobacterium alvei]